MGACNLNRLKICLLATLTMHWLCSTNAEAVDDGLRRECKLLLPRNGHFSFYFDYLLNTLLVTPYIKGHSCITHNVVNMAFSAALLKRGAVVKPDGDWTPEDIAPRGELLLETSRILAHWLCLNPEEIWSVLPSLDVGKTDIAQFCPDFASPMDCIAGKYRRYDGLCNNLHVPTLAATNSVFARMVPPAYSDGLQAPRESVVKGAALPSPRIVSSTMHRDEGYHDHAVTLYLIAWGQFMDHDFTLTATPLDPIDRNEPEFCCHQPPGARKHELCLEIAIPPEDEFYGCFGQRCMDFVRAFSGVRQDCRLGPRAPFNILTGVIDANTVYGGTETHARSLRAFQGGLMRMNDAFAHLGLRELLPPKIDLPDEGCIRTLPDQLCFDAGEIRVNEQLILTAMHTLWFREHNRIARILGQLNSHWDDERIYQESRRIVIAQIQHITFSEFLPQLLGKEVMAKFDIILQNQGYWDGYDPDTDPSMTAAFVAAAYRFGHSLLPSSVERWSSDHKFVGSSRLSKLIRQPWDLYRPGFLDQYFTGFLNQPAQAMDDSITHVTNHLFEEPGKHFGLDLVSFNLQRGREFGIPGYTAYRKWCGLPQVNGFEDLANYMTNKTAYKYSTLFRHVDDIDLWSAGVSERPLRGSLLGATFSCIVAHQMARIRRGDRYWYELPGQPSSFTIDQLQSIRKTSLARVLCDNTDNIKTVQIYPMVLTDHEINPRVPCRSALLPSLNLLPWLEIPEN
ncbi:peroxidase-like [Macrobrachium rosenbergii]|uniref:peroxidase-like n=1 Tax=Macrobrachium rosenbergii TaxID=79674 RepID=UPI0034D61BE1